MRWPELAAEEKYIAPAFTAVVTAFAITFSLGSFYPNLLAGLIFCAISVAASRVILGLHYLSDVLAGMIVGSAIGIASGLLLAS